MKLVALRENLTKTLSLASGVLPSKPTISALSHFLIIAKRDKIEITASDLETTITVLLPGKTEEEGTILLPAKPVLSLLSTLGEEKVVIELVKTDIVITSGKTTISLKTESAENFPKRQQVTEGIKVIFTKEDILKIEQLVVMAASIDSTRAVLTGIVLKGEGETIISAATDGFRLSLLEQRKETAVVFPAVILPGKIVRLLTSSLKGLEGERLELLIGQEEKQLVFSFGDIQIITHQVEGSYPDYQKIIPKTNAIKIVIPRESFIQAVKLSSIFARESSNIIRLKTQGDLLTISANAQHVGTNKTEIEVQREGEDIEIAFNYRFLLDVLQAANSEDVIFETNGALSPGVFRFSGNEQFLHMIMPVRLQES